MLSRLPMHFTRDGDAYRAIWEDQKGSFRVQRVDTRAEEIEYQSGAGEREGSNEVIPTREAEVAVNEEAKMKRAMAMWCVALKTRSTGFGWGRWTLCLGMLEGSEQTLPSSRLRSFSTVSSCRLFGCGL